MSAYFNADGCLVVYKHELRGFLDHTKRERVVIKCKTAAQQFGCVMNEGVVALYRKHLLRERGDVSYSWTTSTLPPAY